MDQNKKTMRHFYCRDALWEAFEHMANDADCSIDYLINESMRYYASNKKYETASAGAADGGALHRAAPPPPPGSPPAAGVRTPPISSTPTLFLIYGGQRYPVSKDQFIIGRGAKSSDLAIKDGNISRKHAAVIRRNGTYYIKDLGSTNGVDYKGMRIDNKRIDEGDIFHICDYELRFTYRPDAL